MVLVIDSERALQELLTDLGEAEWVALDTEADSLHSYPEKLCLIQISIPGRDALVDPLAGLSVESLLKSLGDRELILHGADYDLRLLHRTYGFVPRAIFDTMLAAKLLGYNYLGLEALVVRLLNVQLEKGAQKANWARRPLTERMIRYARNDTHYLKALGDLLRDELSRKGRTHWHQETCERLLRDCSRGRSPDRQEPWRIKGAFRLDRSGLAVLRALWQWREEEAIRLARPPFFILPHDQLVALAAAAAASQTTDPLIPARTSPGRRKAILSAIKAGLAAPPAGWPNPPQRGAPRLTRNQKRRYEELRRCRDAHAAELEIDPSVIASRSALVNLAVGDPSNGDDLMRWQRGLLNLDGDRSEGGRADGLVLAKASGG